MSKNPSHKKMTRNKGFALAALIALETTSGGAQEAPTQSRIVFSAEPARRTDRDIGIPLSATIDKARESFARRQSFYSKEDLAAKKAANRSSDEALKFSRPIKDGDAISDFRVSASPAIVAGFNKPGLSPDPSCGSLFFASNYLKAAGAVGPKNYVQLSSCKAGIFDRVTGAAIAAGPLMGTLAGNLPRVAQAFHPQIIWDPTTNRFYYTLVLEVANEDQTTCFDDCFYNTLIIGFSKTPEPRNLSTDWCRYAYTIYHENLVNPTLGDSRDHGLIGVASYHSSGGYFGPKILAFNKPAAGTACPLGQDFIDSIALSAPLKDPSGGFVVAPAPANQIDTYATGYVVARNGATPSDKLWFFSVKKDLATGRAIFGPARGVTVPTYAIPPDATQPQFTQKLDTGDARLTQAVQGVDTRLGKHAFWTQHTIANGAYSTVRWYEIDPIPATPVVLRWGNTSTPTSSAFHYNASISSDRRRDGAVAAFGGNFVIAFNQSSAALNLSPRIVAGSSVAGGPMSFRAIRNAAGPYQDGTCPTDGSTCFWGLTSSATPDPRPNVSGSGAVWGMSAYSGLASPPATGVNWLTQIFALQP